MRAKLLGIGLIAVGATLGAAGAFHFARQPKPEAPAAAPAPAAPTVAPEPERGPEPLASPEPERISSAPRNAKAEPRVTPASEVVPAKPAVALEPRVEPISTDPPVASDRPAQTETPPAPAPVAPPPEPQKPRFEELTVNADSVLGVRLDSTLSSETARVEDRVNARVSRDLIVDGKVAVPSGARLEGVVTEVARGGKFKDRARIGLTFQTLILADGTKIALSTDTVFRDGEAPNGVNAKVGGSTVVGAIIGAMIGGKKGAIVGGAAGAAGGAAAVAAGDRADVVLTSGTVVTVRLKSPITVLVERHEDPNGSSR